MSAEGPKDRHLGRANGQLNGSSHPSAPSPQGRPSGEPLDEAEAFADEAAPDTEPNDDPEETAGAYETDREDPEALAEPPLVIRELVAACVRFVATKYGFALDGKPETLGVLDQYVRDARSELAVKPEALDVLQSSIGAYLGEVFRARFGGEWFADGSPDMDAERDHGSFRLGLTRVFLAFNPIGMAREALTLEPSEGFHAHLAMDAEDREEVEARLAALGDVDEDEYYLPTTRFDVVELAYESIRARMVERGLGDVRFTAADYRT
jgi:hypothetical protein